MFTYDAENRLISVSRTSPSFSATFIYDGDGNRLKSTVAGVTTILPYTQDRLFIGNWFEWSGSTSTKVRYYYAAGQRLAMRVGSGTSTSTLTYLLGDHLGSTSLTFKADTYATVTQLYKPWGEVRYQSGTLPTDYTYTGQYSHTDDFGLMYYVARWYDPVLGRFAQADSIVPGAGNPMAFDRYAYTLNNPLRYTDPSGHVCYDPGADAVVEGNCDGGTRPINPHPVLVKSAYLLLLALEEEGFLIDGEMYISRNPEDAHRYSTAYMITSGQANPELLEQNPVDQDGNVWFDDDWLYNDNQCIYEAYRCGATMWNAASNSPETQSGNTTCDDYMNCYPEVNYAYEGYPPGDPRRLPNSDTVPVSQHIFGLAVDIQGWAANIDPWDPRIDALAAKFGLYRPYGQDSVYPEPWHFEFINPPN